MPGLAFVLAAMLAGLSCGGPKVDLEARVRQYVSALNGHDVETALAFFHEDARYVLPDFTFQGRDEIRKLLEWNAAVQGEFVLDGLEVRGREVILGPFQARSELYRRLGVPSVRFLAGTRIRFQGDRILEYRSSGLEPESRQQVAAATQAFLAWLQATDPDAVKTLLPEGRFTFGDAPARAWLEWLERWRASSEVPPEDPAPRR